MTRDYVYDQGYGEERAVARLSSGWPVSAAARSSTTKSVALAQ